jgi:hypothetical protein
LVEEAEDGNERGRNERQDAVYLHEPALPLGGVGVVGAQPVGRGNTTGVQKKTNAPPN